MLDDAAAGKPDTRQSDVRLDPAPYLDRSAADIPILVAASSNLPSSAPGLAASALMVSLS
jgi:hypothetical protein